MKTLILSTALILASCAPAHAEPTVSLKIGGWPGAESSRNAGVTRGFMYAVESSTCGDHCFSPYLVHMAQPDGDTSGLGVDYIYTLGRNRKGDKFRVAFGLVGFNDRLNGGRPGNFHVGLSFEAYTTDDLSVLFSIDHFSNGRKMLDLVGVDKNVPSNMLTLGLHF